MRRLNKTGSAMVEAAIIFPLVILAVMTMVYLIINLYLEVTLNVRLHMELTEEAGKLSDTVIYSDINNNGNLYSGNKLDNLSDRKTVYIERENTLLKDEIRGEISNMTISKGLSNRKYNHKWIAVKSIIDEEQFVRCKDIATGIISMAAQ